MAANTVPIYSIAGKVQWSGSITTAVTNLDGTGGATLVFTAGTNGSRIDRVRVKHLGTCVATVLRLFINNGNDPAVAGNNVFIAEKTIAALTPSATAALVTNELPDTTDTTVFPIVLPAGYRLYATLGTTVAGGLNVCAIGSDY